MKDIKILTKTPMISEPDEKTLNANEKKTSKELWIDLKRAKETGTLTDEKFVEWCHEMEDALDREGGWGKKKDIVKRQHRISLVEGIMKKILTAVKGRIIWMKDFQKSHLRPNGLMKKGQRT